MEEDMYGVGFKTYSKTNTWLDVIWMIWCVLLLVKIFTMHKQTHNRDRFIGPVVCFFFAFMFQLIRA